MSNLDFTSMRAAMVSNQLRTNHVSDPRIVAALESVAREKFVPAERAALSYIDIPVPLGGSRSLNAPLVTARLIVEARTQPGSKVLLVGAATGYAAALLIELGCDVTAIEEDASLAARAEENGITVIAAPLNQGWAEAGPYDIILIDGAVETVPKAIWSQLAQGGRLVTGLVDGGVTRLAIGNSAGHGLFPFADAETAILPGFARPRGFTFA